MTAITRPAPTEGAQLAADVIDHLRTYMAFPNEDQPLAIVLWLMHTRTFSEGFPRRPWTTPYLYVHSAEKQSGKTQLIELLEPLALNPERAVDMTSSVLFRLIETVQPTLFIDEVDAIWSGAKNEAMRGVLNGGYKQGGYVWRTVPSPDGPTPTKFATFCPKLLAGIDNAKLPDTIRDRCIPIKLRRKRPDQHTEIYYAYDADPAATELSARIGEWIADNAMRIVDYRPKPIPEIGPRAWEISMPLIQIARALGIEQEAREAIARLLAPEPEKDSPGVAALRAIRAYFETTHADKAHTETLCEAIGEGWNGKLLANRVIRPYEIGDPTTMTIGNRQRKGYYKWQFDDAFTRYL